MKTSLQNVLMVVFFVALFAAGIAYIIWLDSGCELAGAMTWHGKVCVL